MSIKIEKLIPKGFGYSIAFDGDDVYINLCSPDDESCSFIFSSDIDRNKLKFILTKSIELFRHMSTQLDKGVGC